jgi:starch-binding outer membrane protein, SusD/RagB family
MIKLKYITIVCAGAIMFSACRKVNTEYNVDPNNPQDATAELLMNGSMVSTILVTEGNMARFGGLFSKTFTGIDRQYVGYNEYNVAAGDFDDVWGNLYTGAIANAKQAEDKAISAGNFKLAGICEVLQAHGYGLATSLWGDVPFTEAVQPDKFKTPKFDGQASVYASIQTLLDKAIANLSSTKPLGAAASAKDFYFGGSASNWIAVAHSLKARYYLHTRNYTLALSEANLGISSADNDWKSPHGEASGSDINVYYDFGNNQRPGYMDASDSYAIELLDTLRQNSKTDESNRLAYFFSGADLFYEDNNGYGPIFGANSSFPIMTFVETQLIAIEASAKLGNNTGALNGLNGLRTFYVSSNYYGSGSKYDSLLIADFNPGGLYNPSSLSVSAAILKEIASERYVALIGQIEQFNDIRRNKNLVGVVPRLGKPKVPQRMLLPQAEINSNPNTPSSPGIFAELPVWNSPY